MQLNIGDVVQIKCIAVQVVLRIEFFKRYYIMQFSPVQTHMVFVGARHGLSVHQGATLIGEVVPAKGSLNKKKWKRHAAELLMLDCRVLRMKKGLFEYLLFPVWQTG